MDVLTAEPFLKDLNNPDYVVSKVVSRTFFYGIILTGDARCLLPVFQEFLSTITIENPVKPRKSPRVKMVNPFAWKVLFRPITESCIVSFCLSWVSAVFFCLLSWFFCFLNRINAEKAYVF